MNLPWQMHLNKALLDLSLKNLGYIVGQPGKFASFVFLKYLRQAEEHFYQLDELRDLEFQLCVSIWQAKKEECFELGRELIRLISSFDAKIQRLKPIFEDLGQVIEGKPIFHHL